MKSITLKQAKALQWGSTVYGIGKDLKNADGTPMRFKVNGKVKTWKRDPDRVKVPLKQGLYAYGELTNGTFEGNSFTLSLAMVSLEEDTIELEDLNI